MFENWSPTSLNAKRVTPQERQGWDQALPHCSLGGGESKNSELQHASLLGILLKKAGIKPIICLIYRGTNISSFHCTLQVKYHEDFEKNKGTFTPVVTDPITERVKKNMQDFSDISYRGIQRRVVEMERKRVDQDQENLTGKQKLFFFTSLTQNAS